MSTGLITLLLFVPFVSVLLILGPMYLRSGYKRGLWRALISLGGTVVSIFLALILANMIAGTLASSVAKAMPENLFDAMGILKGIVKGLLTGIVQDGLSLMLFSLIFIICIIALKIVVNLVCPGKLQVSAKAYKWGGLGVRAVDTLLVTMLILLPLYGTIATYVTPVAKFADFTMGKNQSAATVLNDVSNHPVVNLYKAGPANWIYKGLSGFSVGDARMDLTKIADTMNVTMQKFNKIKNTKGEDRIQACKELTEYLRDNVVNEDWFYEIAKEASREFENQLQTATSPEAVKEAQLYLELFSAPKDEFIDSATVMLDFMSFAMEGEFMDFAETGDYSNLSSDFHEELAGMLNHSTQTVSLKKMTLVSAAEILFRTQYDAVGMPEDGKSVNLAATEFVEKYWNDGKISKELEAKEAEAIMILYSESNPLAVLEGFARHPLFGYAAVESFVTDEFLALALSDGEDTGMIYNVLTQNPSVRQDILARLQVCGTIPPGKELLDDYAITALEQVM